MFLHGFATTPEIWPDSGPKLSFEDIDREAKRLNGTLEEEIVMIGWSMGGMIAMKIAAMAPEKIGALILVSTTPKFIKSSDFPYGISPALLRKLMKKIKTEGISAFHALVFKNGTNAGLARLTPEQAERELVELAKVDLRNLLPGIKIPTLIIHGDRDEICLPAAAKYMNEKIAGSELVMLKGVGHAPMVEVPELFNSIINKYAGQRAN